MGEGVQISEGMIGLIIGVLLFLVVAFILAFIAVKIFNKRKQREKALRTGKWASYFNSFTFIGLTIVTVTHVLNHVFCFISNW